MKRKMSNASTADLMGVRELLDAGYVTAEGERRAVFLVKPSNLSVISEDGIKAREEGLSAALKSIPELSVACLDSREGYGENKRFLQRRLAEEKNPVIRLLLEEDLRHLDELQVSMATAREFLITVRPTEKGEREVMARLGRVESALTEQGMTVRLAGRDDLKRILAVYFEQNVSDEAMDDVDGERWVTRDEEI
ncbi:MAG: hypothetical protein II743_01295 [Lachnospiraceae bacterium]|nr:hypothetical protein [Lachnospiraceae bacterium]